MEIGSSIRVFRISIIIVICALILAQCKKVYTEVTVPGQEVFNFSVTESQRTFINSTRGEKYEITNPVPLLHYAGVAYTIDHFRIRGENTLNFDRKSFGINLGGRLPIYNQYERSHRKYEKFKLLSMVYDYTYIENSTAAGIFRELGLWPVYSFFTEVRLNNRTQGLYHFVEDPITYFTEQKNSPFILRRDYNHGIKEYSAGPQAKDPETCLAGFRKIYSDIALYSGKQLYDSLYSRMDLEEYFTKLSIDMLLKNGDYTDEVYFYLKTDSGIEKFGIFPWDEDDLFSSQPHEIGKSWAPGTVFGQRYYSSMNDVVADVGQKLLYSIEDDLDYKIAKDTLLYQRYLITLRSVMEKIDVSVIDKVFDNTFSQIGPFYAVDSIINESRYDDKETNYDLFVSNLAAKKQFLKERRDQILTELDLQQKR